MSEEAPHKSHVTGWIIGVVVALMLYMGSAIPVKMLIFRRGYGGTPESLQNDVFTFYKPADWVCEQPFIKDINDKWFSFWLGILGGPVST